MIEAFTPGPWTVVPFVDATVVVAENDDSQYGNKICDVHGKDEHLANARLIAASPDMWELIKALKVKLHFVSPGGVSKGGMNWSIIIKMIEAVQAKVEGKKP
jgi:hypothetical protein